ncbi:MAG: Rpn family recombination-promoting nuclease/putative transposase [Pseudomonadota bacterium]
MILAKQSSPPSVPGNESGRYNFSMKSRSDTLYKQLFAHSEMVRELLAGFMPAAWARSLQVSALERVNASYASERGKQRHQDMVWRADRGGDWVYVDGKLPPVLPIVLYHGRRDWSASRSLTELMVLAPRGLEDFQPRQKYLLVDQHHGKAPDSNVLGILFRLLRSRTNAEMREALSLFVERMKKPDMAPARDSLTRWLQTTLQDEFSETNMDFEEGPTMLFDKRFKKYEDLLEYEAIQKGRKEGQRLALQDVLSARGIAITNKISEKINAADVVQLSVWTRELARGQTPDDLLTAASHPGA